MKLSLRNKFLFSTLVLIIVGMGVISVVSFFSAKNALVKSYNQQLKQISHSNSEFITAWIRDRKRDVANWSEQSGFKTAIQDSFVGKAARKAADTQLKKMKEDYKYFETLNLANTVGEIVSASNEDVIGKINVSDRDYFKQAMKGKQYVSNVLKSRATGNPVFFIASPIEEKGSIVGIFFGVVDLAVFNKAFIDDIKVGENGYAYLYQPDGLVLAHPDKTNILKLNMNEFDFGKEMIAKGSGIITYTWKGSEKVVAFDKEPELGWTVGVGAATAEFLAPVRRIGYINLIVTVGMAVLAAVVIFFIAGTITRGIQRISDGLRNGAEQVSNASNQIAGSSQSLGRGSVRAGRVHRGNRLFPRTDVLHDPAERSERRTGRQPHERSQRNRRPGGRRHEPVDCLHERDLQSERRDFQDHQNHR